MGERNRTIQGEESFNIYIYIYIFDILREMGKGITVFMTQDEDAIKKRERENKSNT